jgi:hypothetical protein
MYSQVYSILIPYSTQYCSLLAEVEVQVIHFQRSDVAYFRVSMRTKECKDLNPDPLRKAIGLGSRSRIGEPRSLLANQQALVRMYNPNTSERNTTTTKASSLAGMYSELYGISNLHLTYHCSLLAGVQLNRN